MVSGAPDYWLRGKLISLIELVNRVALIDEITKIGAITDISNIVSVDLIDRITLIDEITTILSIASIANIVSVDLIDRITLIDEITKIVEIESINKLRDVTHSPSALILNSGAERDFVGWDKHESVTIEESVVKYGAKSFKFPNGVTCEIVQVFPIPIGVNWLTELYAHIRASTSGVNCIQFVYNYSDGTNSSEWFQVTSANTWEKKTLSPTSGKYIESIAIGHTSSQAMDAYLDGIFTRF